MKLKSHRYNPRKFPLNSWNYRCLRLRRGLGWSMARLSRASGISIQTIAKLETGIVVRPSIDTIRRIKNMESEYDNILREFDKSPTRMDRLRKEVRGRVRLLPIEIHRPEDLTSLGKVETDSTPIFFGRRTRQKMQQTGMSLRYKTYVRRRNQAISRAYAKKNAERRGQLSSDKKE